ETLERVVGNAVGSCRPMGVPDGAAAVFFRITAGYPGGTVFAGALPTAGEVRRVLLGVFHYAGGVFLFQGKSLLCRRAVPHIHCIGLGLSRRHAPYGLATVPAAGTGDDTGIVVYTDVSVCVSE